MYEKINKSALITLLVVLHTLPTSPALSLSAGPSNTYYSKKAGSLQCIDHHPLPLGLAICSPLCLGDQVFQGLKS